MDLYSYRLQTNTRQNVMAKRLGLSVQAYQRLERGLMQTVPVPLLIRIEKETRGLVRIADLVDLDNGPNPKAKAPRNKPPEKIVRERPAGTVPLGAYE